MLALSPSLLTTFGWPMEDHLVTQNFQQDYCYENNSRETTANSESLLGFPLFDHDHDHDHSHGQQDFAQENSSFLGGGDADCGTSTDPAAVAKKLNHNASERDRRRRVNDLYSFLRSLLPASRSQKKKVSIPGTVSRALKYIPELQKEVQTLIDRKEKLLSSSPITTQENREIKKLRGKDAISTSCQSSAVSSVSVVGEKEAVMQLITSMNMNMNMNKSSLLSEVIEYLEEEEDGVVLVNATTFKCYGEERLLNTLHFKVKGNHKMDSETLKEKLCSFYQQIG